MPPNGTAGLARSAVRGIRCLPSPPASTMERILSGMGRTLSPVGGTGHNPSMRVDLLTREYPPEVYGGAGVHVEYLARELAPFVDLTVHCMGRPRSNAVAHSPWHLLNEANPALQFLSTDLSMAAALEGCQVAHSHTWYANLAGHLASLLYSIPHVVTTHSLEPQRPWKAEQLGGGYALSSWAEKVGIEGAA